MKRIGIVMGLMLITLSVWTQNYYYYHDSKIYFSQNDYIRNICIDTASQYQQRKSLLDSLHKYSSTVDTFSNFSYRFYVDSTKLSQFSSIVTQNASLIKLNAPELSHGNSIFWSDRQILLKLKSNIPIKPILDSIGVPYISFGSEEYNPLRFAVVLRVDSAVLYAQKIFETGKFDFAEPDFYCIDNVSGLSDNPLFSCQWSALGDSININVLPAWNLTSGKNIKVAVIDVGVQLEHEDLVVNLEEGYDAVVEEFVELNAENGAPETIFDDHGTCCAGIIAAANNQVGCVGVAYNAHVIPIRTAYFSNRSKSTNLPEPPDPPGPPSPIVITELKFQNGWLVDALNNACYVRKADIISLSMAKKMPSGAVETKITEICRDGRDGKGMIMVVSAGNTYKTSVNTIDSLEYIAKTPDVVAVGSVSPCGQRVTMDDNCIITPVYNSCYGDSLDMVAPGLLIPTTDYCDSSIYNDYDTAFAGTSSAAPHVAGVAALILSVNPCLTREEVTYILESTCTKIRPDLYSYGNNPNHPNGTWNIEVGHGLVNAYEAVLLAQQMGGYVFRGQDTISSNTLWDTASLINADLIIDSLATLTITDTLYIAGGHNIIVRPGGKLIVNGGTITNACDGEMWQGIIVEGNANIRQTALAQGSVILNNATVENAREAISTRGSDSNAVYEHTGGIVQATNTLFRNNRRSVEFLSYENHTTGGAVTDNVSYFTRCTFTVDNGNLFAANNVTFDNHVSMWHVRCVKFNGCAFRNETGNHNGKAIYTEEAGFTAKRVCPQVSNTEPCFCGATASDTVTRCTFNGFQTAVHAANNNASYAVTLDNCDFSDNQTGVSLNAADNARVSFCDFDLSGSSSYCGVDLTNSTGYTIESDTLHSEPYSSSPSSIGISVTHSGMAENVIRKNVLRNLMYGCMAEDTNASPALTKPYTGLQFQCNDFKDCYYDILVSNGRIRSVQGSASAGADNDFRDEIYGSFLLSHAGSFTYWYSLPGTHVPYNTPGNGVTFKSTAAANSCTSTLCGSSIPPGPGPLLSGYTAMAEEYAALLADAHGASLQMDETSGNPDNDLQNEDAALIDRLSDLSAQMGDLARAEIRNILNDSVPDMALLKEWYQAITAAAPAAGDIPVSAYQLAEVYSEEGDLSVARTLLSALPQQFSPDEAARSEYANYMALQQLREAVTGNWYLMTDSDIAAMRQVAEYDNGRAARMAKEILCFFHHICYEDEPLLDLDGIGERNLGGDVVHRVPTTTVADGLVVYPNPTGGTLTLESASPIREITVYDLSGRVVVEAQNITVVEAQNFAPQQYTINVSSLQNGLYLLKAVTDSGVQTARFVKN